MSLYRKRLLIRIIVPVILCAIHGFCVSLLCSSDTASAEVNREYNTTATVVSLTETEVSTENTEGSNNSEIELTECKNIVTEPTTVESTKFSKSSNIEDDLFYLAAAVCCEAGSSSEEVQLLVANVVINRVSSPLYPNTVHDVLTQYKQYGAMWKYGISFPKWATQDVKNQCFDVAQRILDGERVCPANVLFQAEFKQGSGVYKEVDGFYFCYY